MKIQVIFTIILAYLPLVLNLSIKSQQVFQTGTSLYDSADDIVVTDNGFFVTGATQSDLYGSNAGYLDVYLAKYSLNFTLEYSRQWGTAGKDYATYLILDPSQTTLFLAFVLNDESVLGAFYASNFSTIWTTSSLSNTDFNDMKYDAIQNVLYVVGATTLSFPSFGQTNNGGQDGFLMQVSPSGTVMNISLYGTEQNDIFFSLELNDTLIICTGNIGSFTDSYQSWIAMYDPTGALQKSIAFGGVDYDEIIESVVWQGNLILLGYSDGAWQAANGTFKGSEAAWVGSMNPIDLTFHWLHAFESGTDEAALGFQGDNIFVVGNTLYEDSDVWITYHNASTGHKLASLTTGSNKDDPVSSMFVTQDGAWIVGYTDGSLGDTNAGDYDMFVQKFVITETGNEPNSEDYQIIAIVIPVVAGVLIATALVATVILKRKKKKKDLSVPEEGIPRQQGQHSTKYEMSKSVVWLAYPSVNLNIAPIMEQAEQNNTNIDGTPQEVVPTRPSSKTVTLSNDWIIDFSEIRLENKIGQGAFGEVYQALYRGTSVAVKQLLVVDDDVKIQDFFAEAELMKGLRPHPNITRLLGVCTNPLCIVTEYVANGSLFSWLKSDKPLDDSTKFEILKGTAAGNGHTGQHSLSGMLHLHRQGVIHRDLAARNILLDKSMNAKVADFGLSRITVDNITNKTDASVGPVKWMAPEALLDRVYNQKTDIWSFGVVIFEVLTRESPYKNYNLMQIGAAVGVGKLSLIPEIDQRAEEFPAVLVSVLKECLKFNPKERPDFQQVVDWLLQGNVGSMQE